jgi:serine/threonine protein kinase
MRDLIGQSLGRYHILEQLGEGGMATVYKAYDTRLERDVAIKVIRADIFGSVVLKRLLERFKREGQALAKLTHPNIVTVLDYGEYEGAPYLVMQYLPGGTLKSRGKKPIPYQDAVRFLIPIAQALIHAHAQGIIHRDIKPANILITKTGEPMLSDFGIAKLLHDEETRELTGTGVGIGTPEYMAPEQGMGKADERADIYALGIVFYELVTGRIPFRADTPMAMLLKKNQEPLPRPKSFIPSLPDAVENVLIKALARDPNQRYPNMSAFAIALERLLSQRSMPSTETSIFLDSSIEKGKFYKTSQPAKGRENRLTKWIPWITGAGILSVCCVIFATVMIVQQGLTENSNQPIETLPANPFSDTNTPPQTISVAETLPPSSVDTTPSLLPPTSTFTPIPNNFDLTFASDRDHAFANLQVFIVNSNNLSEYQLLENPNGYERAQWPTFCGQQIAMEAFDTDSSKPQWIYLLDGENPPRKWDSPVSADALGAPRCSPNGQYMAYSAQHDNYWDLLIADISQGTISFDPDTRSYGKIAGYTSWYNTSQSFMFEVISPGYTFLNVNNFPSSPTLPDILNLGKSGVHPSLSPDGTKAAYACDDGQLCVTDLADGNTQNIFQTKWDVKVGWLERVTPVWSGDGQWIYFATVDGGDWDIFRIRPDGSDSENITRDWPSNEVTPATRW